MRVVITVRRQIAIWAIGAALAIACQSEPPLPPPMQRATLDGPWGALIDTIVDGRFDGSLSVQQTIDLAVASGLTVEGDESLDDDVYIRYFIDPASGQTVFSIVG